MNLVENYKKCWCGEKLTKKNRFSVILYAPLNINTDKRFDEGKPDRSRSSVNYCCEECYQKLYTIIPAVLGTEGGFIYYEDGYPV